MGAIVSREGGLRAQCERYKRRVVQDNDGYFSVGQREVVEPAHAGEDESDDHGSGHLCSDHRAGAKRSLVARVQWVAFEPTPRDVGEGERGVHQVDRYPKEQ